MAARDVMWSYRSGFWILCAVLCIGLLCAAWAMARLGGGRYLLHRLYTEDAWPTYTQRMSQLESLNVTPGGVVLLGDSHVAYGEWSELLQDTKVYNRGVPGAGIDQVRAFAKTLNLGTARAVVVQIGTNDLLFHAPEDVCAMYDRLIVELLMLTKANPEMKLVFVTLPGINNAVRWTGIEPAKINFVNQHLSSAIGSQNAGRATISLLDLGERLGSQTGQLPARHTDDGVHLRGEAYQIWGKALTELVSPGTTFAQ